ncbi:MAG: flagellar basal-body rod protein FlgG [Candidatus Paracaedibacteraceae bacterium]|jgi:flagellar basal-body rod protein FlgG|nr:flagellar basal-body rod protein FlgG [Candidatus Paracaedibacteraceae bacterium]
MSLTNAMNIAKTGLHLQETNIAVKSQNLAAQGVDSFKRQYLVAQDLGYQDKTLAGAQTSANTTSTIGLAIGLGVMPAGIYRSFDIGDPVSTGERLDIMISGDGFYQVLMPDGTFGYTRTATFQRDPQSGQMVTIDGYVLQPNITIPQDAVEVSVSQDGVVSVLLAGQTTMQQVGQMQVTRFLNPNGLRAMGKNIFFETTGSGTPITSNPGLQGAGILMQGYREASNVNSVEEITDLIKIQHAYEQLTKVITTSDAMFDASNRMIA